MTFKGHILFIARGNLSPLRKREHMRPSKKRKKAKQASLAFKAHVRGLIFNRRGVLDT
jgi:hypothetical protein